MVVNPYRNSFDVEEYFEAVAEFEKDWEEPLYGNDEDFIVQPRMGRWAFAHKKVVADSCRMTAVGAPPTRWCEKYGLITTRTFSLRLYGAELAIAFARAFADLYQFFYMFYTLGDVVDYVYDGVDHAGAAEPTALLAAMERCPPDARREAEGRMADLYGLSPTRPIL